MKRARLLILVPVLVALVSLSTAAAPLHSAPLRDFLAGPCPPGAAYHPACDVDHNNQIDILDIQRTASRFNQSGTWVSDNDHTHLGQTWTGVNSTLVISGTYNSWPQNFAPLVLSNPGGYGIWVKTAGSRGMRINSASGHGVEIDAAGNHGMAVNSAGQHGLYVYSALEDGVHLDSAGRHGVVVDSAPGYGIWVASAGNDGVHVNSAGDFGVRIGWTGYDGVVVDSAGTTGVWANTRQSNGEWGFYTFDKIYGSNVAANSLTLIAQVTGTTSVAPGDLVAAAGLADPLHETRGRLPLVRLATNDSYAGVVGVVEGRMALASRASHAETSTQELRSVAGPAQPGDYVAITVLGVAQVKVQDGEAIQPGQRLTAADTPGYARILRTVQVEGVRVDESGPTLGVALETPRDGLVWVLVNPQ